MVDDSMVKVVDDAFILDQTLDDDSYCPTCNRVDKNDIFTLFDVVL